MTLSEGKDAHSWESRKILLLILYILICSVVGSGYFSFFPLAVVLILLLLLTLLKLFKKFIS